MKATDILLMILAGLAAITLFVALAISDQLNRSTVIAPGILDSCSEVERQPCGLSLSGCESGKTYECVTNATIVPPGARK